MKITAMITACVLTGMLASGATIAADRPKADHINHSNMTHKEKWEAMTPEERDKAKAERQGKMKNKQQEQPKREKRGNLKIKPPPQHSKARAKV